MKQIGVLCVVSLCVYQILCSDDVCEGNWDYRNESRLGPVDWLKIYPLCGGNQQSPIGIRDSKLSTPKKENKITFDNYNEKPKAGEYYTISNDGRALLFKFPKKTKYYLKKGTNTFVPTQARMHFGSRSLKGSEHVLNGKIYRAEIHIFHRNKKHLPSAALKHKNGLLVVGVFVRLSSGERSSPIIAKFARHAQSVAQPGNSTKVKAFPLNKFFPCEGELTVTPYVNYQGSLTTPPCAEVVDWVILSRRSLRINIRDLESIHDVLDCDSRPLYGNYRPTQERNGRILYGVNMSED
ncbi:carbonic anhydrase 13-like [Hydractinia symbiolongicarpus]|uniref:carbonic anhydrase 13-like n=1 Tax=Hydractinia symbiolongicarpus TaxID=13093 RepID=UPI00254ACF78|nr:carbonic anhydrase 13-like [Hydractinia symbiolongicarpus]